MFKAYKEYRQKQVMEMTMLKMMSKLSKDYGLQDDYTSQQVMATITRANLSENEAVFARGFLEVGDLSGNEKAECEAVR